MNRTDSIAVKLGVILTLSDLYRKSRPELPEQFATLWKQRVTEVLPEGTKAHYPAVAHTAEEFAAAVAECEQAGCIALVVWPMAYASSGAVLPAAGKTRLPLIIVSTARDATLPVEMTGDHMLANQTVHGAIDLTNALWRAQRPYHLVVGHDSQPEFAAGIQKAIRAASAASVMRNGKVGQVGHFFEGMLDFTFDKTAQKEKLGFEVVSVAPETLIEAAGKVEGKRVNAVVQQLANQYQVDPSFTPLELETSVRYSCALEDIVASEGLDAVAMNFLPVLHAGAESLPFLGASRLMASGVGYAGEGDVMAAMLTTAMARMGGQATFTEIYAPDYERGEVLLAHMGECNMGMANPNMPVKLAARPFPWGKCQPTAVPVFQMQPGMVTLVSISETPAAVGEELSFQLLVVKGEIVEAPDHHNMTSPYTRIRFTSDLPGFLKAYSRAGGTHHLALVHGDATVEMQALAHMLGIRHKFINSSNQIQE